MHSSLREGTCHRRRFKSKKGRLNRDCEVCGSGVWTQTNIKIKDIAVVSSRYIYMCREWHFDLRRRLEALVHVEKHLV